MSPVQIRLARPKSPTPDWDVGFFLFIVGCHRSFPLLHRIDLILTPPPLEVWQQRRHAVLGLFDADMAGFRHRHLKTGADQPNHVDARLVEERKGRE